MALYLHAYMHIYVIMKMVCQIQGKKRSEETKQKISLSMTQRKLSLGEDSLRHAKRDTWFIVIVCLNAHVLIS